MSAQPHPTTPDVDQEGAQKRPREYYSDDIGDSQEEPKNRKRSYNKKGKSWFLTWNNYTETSVETLLSLSPKKWMIQEEKGKEGTPHLQGILTFIADKTWLYLSAQVPECYWDLCRSVTASVKYCSKIDSRNGRIWMNGYKPKSVEVRDPLVGKKLYKYQKAVIKICGQQPHDRRIYWLWSRKGSIGKSALTKHLVLTMDAIVVGGKWRDAYFAITKKVESGVHPRIVIFDLPRSMGNKISYVAIEGIKNGLFFSPKYESVMCTYNPPHIFIFSNEEPDYSQMSKDRWRIRCLDNHQDLKHIKEWTPIYRGTYNERQDQLNFNVHKYQSK